MDCEGFLHKLSPKSILGVNYWQKRYFVLFGEVLKYYKDKQKKKLAGKIPLSDVVDVRVHLTEKTRFDIVLGGTSPRVFSLRAASVNQLTLWSHSVAIAVESAVAGKEASLTYSKTESVGAESKGIGSTEFLKLCSKPIGRRPSLSSSKAEFSKSASSLIKRRSMVTVTANSKGVFFRVSLSSFQNRVLGLALNQVSLEAALKKADSCEDISNTDELSGGRKDVSCSPDADVEDCEVDDKSSEGGTEDEAAEFAETVGGDTVLNISKAGTLPLTLERIGGDAKLLEALTDYVLDRAIENGHKLCRDEMPKPMKIIRKGFTDQCPVINCTKPREDGLLYCIKHSDEFDPTAASGLIALSKSDQEEDRVTLFDSFYETPLEEKIELLSGIFKGDDGLSQAMAIRLLWVMFECTESLQLFGAKFSSPFASASDESARNLLCTTSFRPSKVAVERTVVERMANFIIQNCTDRNCVSIIRDAIMSIACPKSFEMTIGSKDLPRVSSSKTHLAMWKGLFVFTERCSSELRREILEDINFHLIEDERTREWLAYFPGWQKWVLPLLMISDETTFKLSANLFVILHYHCFTDDRSLKFGSVMRESLHVSPTDEIARTLLLTLTNKVLGNKAHFPCSFEDLYWDNLLEFLDIVKEFVFSGCLLKEHQTSLEDVPRRKGSASLEASPDQDSKDGDCSIEDYPSFSGSSKRKSGEIGEGSVSSKSKESSPKSERTCQVGGKGSFLLDKGLVDKVLQLLKAINIEELSWSGKKATDSRAEQIVNSIRNAIEEFKDTSSLMDKLFKRGSPLNNDEVKQITKFEKAKSPKERRKILGTIGI